MKHSFIITVQQLKDQFNVDMKKWFKSIPPINKYDVSDFEITDYGRSQLDHIASILGLQTNGKVELIGTSALKFYTDDDNVITAWRILQ